MMITPIQPIKSLEALDQATTAVDKAQLPFQSLFQDAVNNVKETDQAVQNEVYKLATGQSDNLHNIVIASQKATMSVQLLVQLRNKALDAYNEVMRMSV
ncbi:flagellar hook-basal body complex protein FliE [Faecalispora anaeroviscerum]|uniref:flagellar hook-basal body complex protein FliE n=1 Tax=Faecalispora anaeroviscerum TaxID=2991836 RepID=UPI0024B90E53|nr:flagellar hook-basal body complex protein FliE [Faecalispora anaeroviscerum]